VVRPTPDRVREALFSILGGRCLGQQVLDACAGSGALGLEALSRGAQGVCLVEKSPKVAELLRHNVTQLGLEGAQVILGDIIKLAPRFASEGRSFGVIFVDPPYRLELWGRIIEALLDWRLLAPKAVVVVEHPADVEPTLQGIELTERRRYGSVALSFCESE
jgi:16S rRNA (guanine966-N2)-methyltransferase